MRLTLIMLGRFEQKEGYFYGDKKNINAIKRYLKYFNEIKVVAREKTNRQSLYPLQKIDCEDGKISFHLVKDCSGILDLGRYLTEFNRGMSKCISESDIVLCWAEPKSNMIVKTAHKFKKPCIVYVGGCNKDTLLSSKSFIKKMLAYFVYYSVRKAVMNADYVHYVTEKELQKRYPTKGKHIGASYVNIVTDISQETIDKRINRYNDNLDSITLGLIGYLNPIKGIDTAITALSKLDSKFTLKILGGGDIKKYKLLATKLGVEDRVFFDGTLPTGDSVLKWLDNIDIYLQPSRTEGLPRATIEAMSRGCPVISSNAMGLVELVNKEYRHKPGDSKKLIFMINRLVKDPIELQIKSKNSFKIAQNYNRTLLDNRIDNFFNEILFIKDQV